MLRYLITKEDNGYMVTDATKPSVRSLTEPVARELTLELLTQEVHSLYETSARQADTGEEETVFQGIEFYADSELTEVQPLINLTLHINTLYQRMGDIRRALEVVDELYKEREKLDSTTEDLRKKTSEAHQAVVDATKSLK